MRGSGPWPTPLVPGKRWVNQESCSGVNGGGAVVPDVVGVLLGATTVVGGGGAAVGPLMIPLSTSLPEI